MTLGLEGRCSIQLSYGRTEAATPVFSHNRSRGPTYRASESALTHRSLKGTLRCSSTKVTTRPHDHGRTYAVLG